MANNKEMVGFRLSQDIHERVLNYADDHDISKSEALRRMVVKGVDLEDAGLTVTSSKQATEENEPVPDGGYIRLSDHPWVDPLITVGDYSALIGMVVTFVAIASVLLVDLLAIAGLVGKTGVVLWVGGFYALMVLGGVMAFIALLMIIVLEYLMHPSEAPIRRYFHDNNDPEMVQYDV